MSDISSPSQKMKKNLSQRESKGRIDATEREDYWSLSDICLNKILISDEFQSCIIVYDIEKSLSLDSRITPTWSSLRICTREHFINEKKSHGEKERD